MRICETFISIQGEGLMIGAVTFFIRMSGCNLECKWCDTKYSREEGTEMPVADIIVSVGDMKNVCITGGEPLIQDEVYDLVNGLLRKGKHIVLETNGSVDISSVPADPDVMISMDIKCPSSGMEDRMLFSNMDILKPTDQLKFVISDGRDLEYAMSLLEERPVRCNVIFTPVGGMDIEPLAEEIIEQRINARVLPQLHKMIWGNERSV